MTIRRALLLGAIVFAQIASAQHLEIRNGSYYLDGRKFFVKGIGYEANSRPGRLPWVYRFDPDEIRLDLARIKGAGFNTIRTWAPLSEEQLQLVNESGLKILFGIWVDNGGAYGDSTFRSSTLGQVRTVLQYTRKYPCVIGYLIMNEPQIDQIAGSGAQNLRDLWLSIVDEIHRSHAGVPVSFSNALVGDFIDAGVFDFTAFNAYCYNPATISHSHGYAGFLKYLKTARAAQQPFLVTEFGLSVSPGTAGADYGYGGNTPEQQAEGDLMMYRGLIDAGAQGGAVFQYQDGWWKSGNEWVHDPLPEEWFGLIAYSGLDDVTGTPRPAWQAIARYNKAIITEPKNESVYGTQIPIELFLTEDIRSFSIVMNDSLLLHEDLDSTYYAGTLSLSYTGQLKDALLTFYFYDADGAEAKTETISLLSSKTSLALPAITLKTNPANLNPGGRQNLIMEIVCDTLFTIDGSRIDYVSHPHIGYDLGTSKSGAVALADSRYMFSDYFDIPAGSKVTTFGAGMTIRRGSFTRRICAQRILTSGHWADPIKAADVLTGVGSGEAGGGSRAIPEGTRLDQNYPNPFNPSTTIRFETSKPGHVSLRVFDLLGREAAVLVDDERPAGHWNVRFDCSRLANGVYFYALKLGEFTAVRRMVVMK